MNAAPDTRSFSREPGETARPGEIKECLGRVLDELLVHGGHGQFDVRLRWVGKGLKEVCIVAGKEYRFVVRVAAAPTAPPDTPASKA